MLKTIKFWNEKKMNKGEDSSYWQLGRFSIGKTLVLSKYCYRLLELQSKFKSKYLDKRPKADNPKQKGAKPTLYYLTSGFTIQLITMKMWFGERAVKLAEYNTECRNRPT